MLQADRHPVVLDPPGIADREPGAQEGILAQVFVRPAAGGDPLDVDGRGQDHVLSPQPGLPRERGAVGIGQFGAPGGGQGGTGREEGGLVVLPPQRCPAVGLHLLAHAEGPVGVFQVGDPEALHPGGDEHVLGVKHVHFFLERHPAEEGVDLPVVSKQRGGAR